ncbi:MAG: DNA cytosine methyltransferase, partial [Candidatus Azotimanducaceae bacterium WSBS_2022_MAG_OTU7]
HAIRSLPKPALDKSARVESLDIPDLDEFDTLLRDGAKQVSDHYCPEIKGTQLARITALKPGQTMKDLPSELQHSSFKKRAHRRVADGTPSEKRGGAPSGLKRLYLDEPSLTITGAATRELIHPVENRPLTIREAARIQTFPDSFEFVGNSSQKIQQIGNAIPPILARILAEHIKDDYGFSKLSESSGELLGFKLTKAGAMSPALKHTEALLDQLMQNGINKQGNLFL